jgi:hypothetical protein
LHKGCERNKSVDAKYDGREWPDWARNYVKYIKGTCPTVYAWQYDDLSSTYTCQPKSLDFVNGKGINIYDVTLTSSH